MAVPIAGLLSGAAKIAGATRSRGSGAKLAGSIVKREPKKTEENSAQESKNSSALAIRPKQSLVPYKNIESVPPTDGMTADDKVIVIHTKIIEIDNLLKGTLAADKNLIDQRNRQEELEEEKKREEKLEKKDDKEKKPDKNKLKVPKMGIFGAVGNFITNVVLGFILTRLVDHAPKLEGIIKAIATGIEWLADFVIFAVDALGTFLKIGYDAYKATEGFIKNIFGDDGVKAFHGFTDALSSFFNAVVIVGMAAAAIGNELDLFNNKNKKPKTKPKTKPNKVDKKLKSMGLDDDQIKAYNKARQGGATTTQALQQAKKVKPKPKGFFGKLGDGIKKVGQSALDATTGAFKSMGSGLNKISGGNLGKLGDFLGEQYNNVSKFAKNKFDKVATIGGKLKSKFGSAMNSVKGAIGNMAESAKKAVVQKIIEPIKPLLDPVIKKVKSIGSSLMDKLGKIPGAQKIGEVLKKKGINGIGDTAGILKKVGGKALPIVGGLFNLLFAYDRLANGDTLGALIEFASAGFDISGLFGFVPGPGISMGIDAYMFARDFIPLLQEGEENVINAVGLGGLKSNIDSVASKLPDLGSIVKMITGGDKESVNQGQQQGEQGDDSSIKTSSIKNGPIMTGDLDLNTGASNVAGEAGKFIEQNLKSAAVAEDGVGDYLRITEHPDFGGVRGSHAPNSYHDYGRALDIGAWTHEQGPIVDVLNQFNEKRGVQPKELITGANFPGTTMVDPGGHGDHVHVAYQHGGFTKGTAHKAIIGEVGPEFVIDSDSAMAIEGKFPGLLDAINTAKGKKSIEVLENYASYENTQTQVIIIEKEPEEEPMEESGGSGMSQFMTRARQKMEDFTEFLVGQG